MSEPTPITKNVAGVNGIMRATGEDFAREFDSIVGVDKAYEIVK
jgi:hypothetical protein